MNIDRFLRNSILALVVALHAPGCSPIVDAPLSEAEIIRQQIENGGDESILFSSAVLFDQSGTNQFSRSLDSLKREYVNLAGALANGFYEDNVETPSTRQAFEADIVDRLWGTITYRIGLNNVTRPYSSLSHGGRAKFLKIGPNWELWRLEHRRGFKRAGDGSPHPQSIVVESNSASQTVNINVMVREFRDSLITLTTGTIANLTVTVISNSPNDTFFVTYPVIGGYQTTVMSHDSLTHVATVGVSSLRRYELLAIQGFKSEAFKDSTYSESLATTIQTAMIAFRP